MTPLLKKSPSPTSSSHSTVIDLPTPAVKSSPSRNSSPKASTSTSDATDSFHKEDEEKQEEMVYDGAGTESDPYVVKFRPGDSKNPMNFSQEKKWIITANVAIATLCVAFGSSIFAGGFGSMLKYFQVSTEVLTLGLSLYVAGFVVGPLLWAPFSEMYGRIPVFRISYLGFVLFQIGCALAQNIETLLVCRFFAGFFGAAPLTNSGGTISDMFSGAQRGLAVSFFALAPFLGPTIGPIVGGYMSTISFRYLFWLMLGFSGVMYILGLLIPETYAPVLLRKEALRLSTETGRCYVSQFDLNQKTSTLGDKLKHNLTRPFTLLFTELIVFLISLWVAILYGTLYLLFGAFPFVFQAQRGFSPGQVGLAFIGIAVGIVIGVIGNIFENRRYVRQLEANGGKLEPEARLPMAVIGGCLLPIGLIIFAWTSSPNIHYIIPIIATVPFGTAASVLAANAVLRSIFGAVFPLFTESMFKRLGTEWALTLVAFLSLVCTPIPFLFVKYGAAIRTHSKYAPTHAPAVVVDKNAPTAQEKENIEDLREIDLRQEQDEAAEIAREQLEQKK